MYKVTNKLNQRVKLGDIMFKANETKTLDSKPYSDKFIVEEIKSEKKPTKLKENKE